MYKKRRRSSWPSQLLAVGLLLGGSLVATSVFAGCGGAAEPITITPGEEPKSCKIEDFGSDQDSFAFATTKGNKYQVIISDVGTDIDIAMVLKCGSVELSADQNFTSGKEELTYPATPATSNENCSLLVFQMGYFGSDTGYQLSITEEPPPKVESKPKIELGQGTTQPLQVEAGKDSSSIIFKVTDQNNGQVMSGQTMKFSWLDGTPASGGTFTTTPDPATTLADGQISLVLTAPTKAGVYKIKAEISGSTATPAEVTVTVVAGAPTKLKQTENGCQTSPPVGTACTMTFELMDAYENKIDPTGKSVSFTVTPPSSDSKVNGCEVSIANGQIQCKLTPDSAGSYKIASATVDNTAIPFDPTSLPVVQVKAAPSTLVLAPKEGTMPPATVGIAYTVTFILTENGNPKGRETVHFEMTTKPPESNASLTPTTDQPTADTGNVGEVSVSFTPDIAGQYVIKASLVSGSTVIGSATVTANAVEPSTPTLNITNTCPSPLPKETTCSFTFTLTGGDTEIAKTINVSWIKPGSSNLENLPSNVVQIATGSNQGSTNLTFDSEGSYTIAATYGTVTKSTSVTVSPASTPPPQPTSSLTVTGGGNQSIVQGQKSQSITFQVKETGTNTPVPDKKIEIALTVPNVHENQAPETLLANVALSPPVLPLPSPTTIISTNSKGEATVEVSFEKKTGMTGVTTYLLSAKLKDNPGVADYTNVFLLEKPLEDLLKTTSTTWPILQVVKDEEGTLETNGTGTGSATDKGGQDLPGGTTAIFHGGLNGQQQAKVGLTDTVTVQGVIEIDSTHLGQVADIVVFGANDSPKGWDKTHPDDEIKADGCYMLDSSFPVNILSLGSDKACQLGKDEVSKPVPFRRGVTLAKEMLVEMYTGKFVYPATPLKIYFGYRLTDGTLVYNGSNPIYITIEEK